MKEEEILCFNRRILEKYNLPKVFKENSFWNTILENLESIPISSAEKNYDYKQLVSYVIVKAGKLFLTYRRTQRSWEEDLRGKYSIGIGGHISLLDKSQRTRMPLFTSRHERTLSFVLQSIWREIDEEIHIKSGILGEPRLICFISDDSNKVGWKHFGTVWLLRIREPQVSAKKGGGLGKLEFRDFSYLKAHEYDFEKWSRLLIEHFVKEEV